MTERSSSRSLFKGRAQEVILFALAMALFVAHTSKEVMYLYKKKSRRDETNFHNARSLQESYLLNSQSVSAYYCSHVIRANNTKLLVSKIALSRLASES